MRTPYALILHCVILAGLVIAPGAATAEVWYSFDCLFFYFSKRKKKSTKRFGATAPLFACVVAALREWRPELR